MQILTDFKMSILGQSAVKHSSNKSLGTMVTGSSLAHETQVIQGFRIPATVNPEDGLRLPSRHLCLAHKFSKTIQTGLQIVSWSLSPQSRVSVCVCVCVCDMIDSSSSVQNKPPFKRCHFQVRFLICNWCFCYLCSWCEAIETTLD